MRALGEDGVECILSLGCRLIGGSTLGSTRLNLLEGYPGVQSGTDGEVCHVGLGARVILPGVEWLVNFAKFIICAVCNKQWRIDNKERISKTQKKKVKCQCGCIVAYSSLTTHKKSAKHNKLMHN